MHLTQLAQGLQADSLHAPQEKILHQSVEISSIVTKLRHLLLEIPLFHGQSEQP